MFNNPIYQHSPIFIQNSLISLRASIRKLLRENKKQHVLLSEIENNDFSAHALDLFRNKKLSKVLKNAIQNVPFYRSILTSKTAELENFPIISKLDVKENQTAFLSESHSNIVITGATSGTTGSPLVIKQNLESVIREQAFVARHLKWAGFKLGDKRAWIRGDRIVPISQTKPPFWRYSFFEDMIMLSSFHLAPQNLQSYIDAMVDYGVNIIQAYPSSIITLAKHLETQNQYYPGKLKSIVTSSESLSLEDKQLIEVRFQCTVFDWYGLFERVAAIGSCEYGRYHILTDYSHVELIDSGDGRHEIIGTNFNNDLQPLIRYRTGDYVYLSKDDSCPCGRTFPIIKSIDGRTIEFLYTEGGHKIFSFGQFLKNVDGLLGTQYIQHSPDELTVNVIANSKFDEPQKHKLINNIQAILGKGISVNVKQVSALVRTKNGKLIRTTSNVGS
ncbi:phenylacetate--CoA ligase family protein [Vibrio alfacsensis]|uniref:phenylacetate--CoA ligase family protein n=1 Tax=Vibrio alfacsensis TaxID=1074311 RepID=UPI0040676A4D